MGTRTAWTGWCSSLEGPSRRWVFEFGEAFKKVGVPLPLLMLLLAKGLLVSILALLAYGLPPLFVASQSAQPRACPRGRPPRLSSCPSAGPHQPAVEGDGPGQGQNQRGTGMPEGWGEEGGKGWAPYDDLQLVMRWRIAGMHAGARRYARFRASQAAVCPPCRLPRCRLQEGRMKVWYEELRGKLDCFEQIADRLDAGFKANQVGAHGMLPHARWVGAVGEGQTVVQHPAPQHPAASPSPMSWPRFPVGAGEAPPPPDRHLWPVHPSSAAAPLPVILCSCALPFLRCLVLLPAGEEAPAQGRRGGWGRRRQARQRRLP